MHIYHTAVDRTPFTYLLTHKTTKKRYYGSRYGKNCHPSQLGNKYLTSSPIIKEIIKMEGKEAFIWEVRLICNSEDQARRLEAKFLSRINAKDNPDWYNRSNGSPKFKGGFKGKKHTAKYKLKISTMQSGENNSFYGKHHTEEFKAEQSKKSKGVEKPFEVKLLMSNNKKSLATNKTALGKRWMYHPELKVNKLTKEFDLFESLGYIYGHLAFNKKPDDGKIWMHNKDYYCTRVKLEDVEFYRRKGFIEGGRNSPYKRKGLEEIFPEVVN